jgi:hypothetical protein
MMPRTILGWGLGLVLGMVGSVESARALSDLDEAPRIATMAWLKMVDEGDAEGSWRACSPEFQKSITEEAWKEALVRLRKTWGAVKSRQFIEAQTTTELPGGLKGQFVGIRFQTTFADGQPVQENILLSLQEDRTWRVAAYSLPPK